MYNLSKRPRDNVPIEYMILFIVILIPLQIKHSKYFSFIHFNAQEILEIVVF